MAIILKRDQVIKLLGMFSVDSPDEEITISTDMAKGVVAWYTQYVEQGVTEL